MTRTPRNLTPARTFLGLSGLALLAAACNVAPTGAEVAVGPEAPTTADDLVATITREATDENGDDLIIGYQWAVQGAGGGDFFERPEFISDTIPSTATTKGDTWRVIVTATDGSEAAPPSEPATVTVVNTPPTTSYARISPSSGVDTFGTLTASGAAADIDGDSVEVTYTWFVDGTALDVVGNVLTGEHFSKNNEVWVEVTANDGDDDGAPVASAKVVIDNTAPKLSGVRITQEEVLEGTEVTCEAVGWYDADDDPPNVDATWLVNGVEVSSDAVLTGALFDKGDLIRCAGVPNDGDSLGQLYVSPVIQVGNTPPTLGGAALSNTSPGALDVLTVSAVDAVDVDGDDLTFVTEWYVEGDLVHTGEELPARSFVKGDQVWAVVTPFDGIVSGEPVTSDVATAVNTPPVLSAVNLTPADMYTDDIAFPSVEVDDVDGDSLTYTVSWLVNGTAVGHTASTLDGDTWFDKGDTVQVEVTPNDGDDDGASMKSAEITVLNSPPAGPEVEAEDDKVKDDVDLRCLIEYAYDDADEDDLEYTFTWTVNGEAFTGAIDSDYAGDTISWEDTTDLDDWVCTLSVTDGTDTVVSEATIEVRNWDGPRNFDNCGQTGYSGPSLSQCEGSYADSPILDDGLTVSGGIQEWTVPQDGTYRIEAYGAQGGRGQSYSYRYDGYKGARVRGDFTLTAGQKIRILVGQMGSNYSSYYSASGGGGTYVTDSTGKALVVAGGGGGNGYSYYKPSGCTGNGGSAYGAGAPYSSSSCSVYSTSASTGGSYFYSSSLYFGFGGAGFTGNGSAYSSYSSWQARSFTNGGQGGNGYYVDGGFGGGGATTFYYGGGGGGGYKGGNGSRYRGGGGGSYNAGSNQSSASGARAGQGRVIIDLAP